MSMGEILLSVLLFATGVVLITSRFGIRARMPRFRQRGPSPDHAGAHAHPPAAAHGSSHAAGEGHHDSPPLWSRLLGWVILAAAVFLLARFIVMPFLAERGFGEIPGMHYEASAPALPAHAVRAGAETVACDGQLSVVAMIGPGDSVLVHVPPRTRIDFTPSTDTGRVSFCSRMFPSKCDPPGPAGVFVNDDTFTVTNTGNQTVEFRCWYSPL